MYCIESLEDEISQFSNRVGIGAKVDPDQIEYIVEALTEQLNKMKNKVSSNPDIAEYMKFLEAQKQREESILKMDKIKQHDHYRVENRIIKINHEIDIISEARNNAIDLTIIKGEINNA